MAITMTKAGGAYRRWYSAVLYSTVHYCVRCTVYVVLCTVPVVQISYFKFLTFLASLLHRRINWRR
jgi:hypothetical protein